MPQREPQKINGKVFRCFFNFSGGMNTNSNILLLCDNKHIFRHRSSPMPFEERRSEVCSDRKLMQIHALRQRRNRVICIFTIHSKEFGASQIIGISCDSLAAARMSRIMFRKPQVWVKASVVAKMNPWIFSENLFSSCVLSFDIFIAEISRDCQKRSTKYFWIKYDQKWRLNCKIMFVYKSRVDIYFILDYQLWVVRINTLRCKQFFHTQYKSSKYLFDQKLIS